MRGKRMTRLQPLEGRHREETPPEAGTTKRSREDAHGVLIGIASAIFPLHPATIPPPGGTRFIASAIHHLTSGHDKTSPSRTATSPQLAS